MSALSESLAAYPDSRAVAKFCESAQMPMSGLFARLMIDRPPFAPNMVKQWAEAHPNVDIQSFIELDEWFVAHPEIKSAILDNIQRHAPHLWAKPLTEYGTVSRVELFSRPVFQTGMLKPITPIDDQYTQCSIAHLTEWLQPYRDVYPYSTDKDDCDNKAGRITGYFDRCPHPRPQVGECVITGMKDGNPEGHYLNFAVCTDGIAMIENDGSVHVLDTENRSFNVWTNINISFGRY